MKKLVIIFIIIFLSFFLQSCISGGVDRIKAIPLETENKYLFIGDSGFVFETEIFKYEDMVRELPPKPQYNRLCKILLQESKFRN